MAWYSSWTRAQRLAITVPAATVAPVSYFPVVLTAASLPTELTNNSYGRSDGGDLAFAADLGVGNSLSSIGTQIPCEVVAAVFGGSPSAEIHVQVPSVAATGTLTYIWVLYGSSVQTAQPATNSTYGSQKVWNENGVQNYQGVYHLQGTGTPSTWSDSTSLANTGTNSGAVATAGAFGGGASFNGATPNSITTHACKTVALSSLTLSCWLNPTTIPSYGALMLAVDGGNTYGIDFYSRNISYQWVAVYQWNTSGLIPSYGAWTYIAEVFQNNSKPVAYAGTGGSLASATTTLAAISTATPASGFDLMWNPSYTERSISGVLDEVRISLAVRSASWIAAEYANQFAPSTFILPSGSPLPITSTTLTAAMLLLGF